MTLSVEETYDELWHYTSAVGLHGIISTSTVWASSASFLNDSTEVKHFFDVRLVEIAMPVARAIADQKDQDSTAVKEIEEAGGMEQIVIREVDALVASLRNATLKFNDPFIFSMSAPMNQCSRESGLLSQWRGYGTDGGFAIVFESSLLGQQIKAEAKSHAYQHMGWGDVFYHGYPLTQQPATEEIEMLEKEVQRGIETLIRKKQNMNFDKFYDAITTLSCFYKHWGFFEEGEIRLVAIPSFDIAAEESVIRPEDIQIKQRKTFTRGGIHVPYIELFSSSKAMLPIKRVVVGPHIDAVARKTGVERLLHLHGYSAPVVCSEIPYIGR